MPVAIKPKRQNDSRINNIGLYVETKTPHVLLQSRLWKIRLVELQRGEANTFSTSKNKSQEPKTFLQ